MFHDETTILPRILLSAVVGACWLAGGLLGGAPVAFEDAPPPAKDEGDDTQKRLVGWGRLGAPRGKSGGFHSFTLYRKDERGKTRSLKMLVQIPDDVELLIDRQVRVGDIKKGEELVVFGRPEEFQVESRRGVQRGRGKDKDRQIQNSQIVVAGEHVAVNEDYQDVRDAKLKWCRGAAATDGAKGIWMDFEGEEHRVSLAKGAPLLRRRKPSAKLARKLLKKGVYFWIEAEPPPGDASTGDGRKAVFTVRKLVSLDRRFLRTAYLPVLK